MAKTTDDLSREIAALKDDLIKVTEPLSQKEKKDKKDEDNAPLVSVLKAHLIDAAPKITTEEFVRKFMKDFFADAFSKIKDMHTELSKDKKTEMLEGLGLGGFAAAWEKYKESQADPDAKIAWKDWLYAAIGGAVLALVLPVFVLMVVSQFQIVQRAIQKLIFNKLATMFPTRLGHLANRTVALTDNQTRPGLIDRTHLQQREDNLAGGMAAIPRNANFSALRYQLQLLNPYLETFNQHAPGFVTNFDKMPRAGVVTKIAKAVEKIKDALTGVNAGEMGNVADAVNKFDPDKMPDPRKLDKLNKAVDKAKPDTMRAIAKAVGKLVGAQQHLEPERWQQLPKANTLSSAAKSAERLAKAGREVAEAFDALKIAAQQTAAQI